MRASLQGTRIGHARIRAAGADAAQFPAACGTLLASLDLEPAALSPHAILCVRALRDPLPDTLEVRPGRPHLRPFAWESAMRAELDMALRRAARPIDGPVPADAVAVLFADEAEMLACAARDACGGPLSWFWWWRHLLHDASFDRVVAAWRDAPSYVPAAFESLARTGAAASFIRKLRPSSAAALVDATLRAHALPALADAVAAVWCESKQDAGRRGVRPSPGDDIDAAPTGAEAARASNLASPWRGAVPAEWESPALPLVSRTFAAMCIVLRRAPWLPRTEHFSRTLVPHLREARRIESAGRHRIESAARRTRPAPNPEAHPLTTNPPDAEATSASRTRERDLRTAIADSPDAVIPTEGSEIASPRSTPRQKLSTASRRRSVSAPDRRDGARGSGLDGLTEVDADVSSEPPGCVEPASREPFDVVESAYAGAFFLINVAIDLGLYGHGITVVDELELSVWRFVDIVARELLIDHDSDDPLWRLLLTLARSDSDPIPADAEPDLPPAERDGLVARVRMQLAEALGDIDDPAALLIRQRGRIVRSPGHLDARFALEHHPIEIRAARLDRNPGWIPAAGVHIGFHFD